MLDLIIIMFIVYNVDLWLEFKFHRCSDFLSVCLEYLFCLECFCILAPRTKAPDVKWAYNNT